MLEGVAIAASGTRVLIEGKYPYRQVYLLLRARLLTLKTKDSYHGH
jgi:hypothetical protein